MSHVCDLFYLWHITGLGFMVLSAPLRQLRSCRDGNWYDVRSFKQFAKNTFLSVRAKILMKRTRRNEMRAFCGCNAP